MQKIRGIMGDYHYFKGRRMHDPTIFTFKWSLGLWLLGILWCALIIRCCQKRVYCFRPEQLHSMLLHVPRVTCTKQSGRDQEETLPDASIDVIQSSNSSSSTTTSSSTSSFEGVNEDENLSARGDSPTSHSSGPRRRIKSDAPNDDNELSFSRNSLPNDLLIHSTP